MPWHLACNEPDLTVVATVCDIEAEAQAGIPVPVDKSEIVDDELMLLLRLFCRRQWDSMEDQQYLDSVYCVVAVKERHSVQWLPFSSRTCGYAGFTHDEAVRSAVRAGTHTDVGDLEVVIWKWNLDYCDLQELQQYFPAEAWACVLGLQVKWHQRPC